MMMAINEVKKPATPPATDAHPQYLALLLLPNQDDKTLDNLIMYKPKEFRKSTWYCNIKHTYSSF